MRPIMVAAVAALVLLQSETVPAQDGWRPFADRDDGRRPAAEPARPDDRPVLPPMDGLSRWLRGEPASRPPAPTDLGPDASSVTRNELPPLDPKGSSVQSGELAPSVAPDGSGLPFELWQGLDIQGIEAAITTLDIPPRSPALGAMWVRLLTADVSPPAGGAAGRFEALRLEALYRSGLVGPATETLARLPAKNDAILALMQARLDVARGRAAEACGAQRGLAVRKAELPPPLRVETLLIGGYCAAATGNASAAGLAAELAREEGAPALFTLELLDSIALGQPPGRASPNRLSALDYRLLKAAGVEPSEQVLDRAEPALLAVLAEDGAGDPALGVMAAEAAARMTAISGERLAETYRRAPTAQNAAGPALRRAALFRAAEQERTPQRKARAIRAFLDDARRAGLYFPAAEAMARAVSELQVTPEIGWFAETSIEVSIVSGRYAEARRIATTAGFDRANEPLDHWLALADIADPALPGRRGETLDAVERLAMRGRYDADLLHRLATVLDALDYNVPIPLWNLASRTPQPTGGHLPGTGVLTELAEASKQKQYGRTVILAMKALGPDGADRANMIALGDAIRALRRAGFDADARRVGLEALFTRWPRSTSN